MPSLSLSSCHSDADCSGVGRCVQNGPNGLFNCNCAVGYAEPHCKHRDPCLLEGNTICQNGSTCKRVSNHEYECKCRVPYYGKFCETYDLCHIDVEECIGDLNTENPQDSNCYPCVAGAICTQVYTRYYTCSCNAGFNHSSCFAFEHIPTLGQFSRSAHTQLEIKNESKNGWSPKIPSIAATSFCLYFLFLFIVLILLRKRKKCRPKIIICSDIREFDDLTYYLVSVKTGWQWKAGAKSNVYCFLCGENGQAGPYPLNDLNLSDMYVLQRCQEDNYLFSNSTDLGRIDKIVLWCDNQWFCEKIAVRNIKTEENWYFYVSVWFNSKQSKRFEFLSTSAHVQKQTFRINYQYCCDQLARHHTYISPWVYTSPHKLTLMFAEWMSYMLILTALHGFIICSDEDIDYAGVQTFSENVSKNGLWAALCGLGFGLTSELFLMTCPRVKRIPTLLARYDYPCIPENKCLDMRKLPIRSPSHTDTTLIDFDELALIQLENKKIIEKMKKGRMEKQMVQQTVSTSSQNVFPVPSTDTLRKKWVEICTKKLKGRGDGLDEENFNNLKQYNHQTNMPRVKFDNSLIGNLKNESHLDLYRFAYAINANTSSKSLHTTIETHNRAIKEYMLEPSKYSLHDHQDHLDGGSTPDKTRAHDPRILFNRTSSYPQQSTEVTANDAFLNQVSETDEKKKVYYELCEMEIRSIWRKMSVMIIWIACLCFITAATITCCIYGERYGYHRTYNWIISLAICWVENVLVFQFLKVLIIIVVTTVLFHKKKSPMFETKKLRQRFQVYYANEFDILPNKNSLKFVQYLPENWMPAPHVKLNYSNTKSSTSTINSVHDA